jgi:hypothetical protein
MPGEIVFLNLMEMVLTSLVFIVLGLPIIRLVARRFDRRDVVSPPHLAKIEERLARLETGVESIAVEVERISEGQRFTARLLAERAGELPSRPSASAR